ncbi:uncharacterized protein [Haliotis cracherodii]|uniref:uncharacterized protein n=1 Tax=Haliotis cracherodii TaxID=6455 RepID=UPI0039EB6437
MGDDSLFFPRLVHLILVTCQVLVKDRHCCFLFFYQLFYTLIRMICFLVLALACGALSAPTTAPNLTALLSQAFNRIDADGSGSVDVSEFLKVFDQYDLNHDGKMTIEEYMTSTHVPKTFAQEVYKTIDSDHDNAIKRSDMNSVFAKYDTSGNGLISLAEFVTKYKEIFAQVQKNLSGQ